MYHHDREGDQKLVGRTVKHIYMNEEYLRFDTDEGPICFTVEGDCCSHSYFWDFLGVEKLLKNGPIISVEEIELAPPDDTDAQNGECVVAYGFRFITEDPTFGEVSSVMSFRNDSNGYYGGWMLSVNYNPEDIPELTADCLGIEH